MTKKITRKKATKPKRKSRSLARETCSGYTSNDSHLYEITYDVEIPGSFRKGMQEIAQGKATPMFRKSALRDFNRVAAALSRCDSCPNMEIRNAPRPEEKP